MPLPAFSISFSSELRAPSVNRHWLWPSLVPAPGCGRQQPLPTTKPAPHPPKPPRFGGTICSFCRIRQIKQPSPGYRVRRATAAQMTGLHQLISGVAATPLVVEQCADLPGPRGISRHGMNCVFVFAFAQALGFCAFCQWRPENCSSGGGGGGHGGRTKGGGWGLEKWASVPGPLFCVTMDVGAEGARQKAEHRFWPEKVFSTKSFSPYICVVKMISATWGSF